MSLMPLIGRSEWEAPVQPDGGRPQTSAFIHVVRWNFLETMGMPLLTGRDLTAADAQGRPRVAVVNATMARQVFGEDGVYDAQSGQLLSGSFMDYFMPRAGMIPRMNVGDEPLPTKLNALGAKGVGEAGCGGSLPALTNAVMNALGPLGIHHLDMPLTPNKVWQAIRGAQRRQ